VTVTNTQPSELNVENEDEPYLEGLRYHAMPPLKRFRDMEHLSGGEKTIAALALLFAVHSFKPSPFFVLDEVDAALDTVNVGRVANYVKKFARPGMQFIVISLKATFFQESEGLVGVMRDQSENSSRVVTLDVSAHRLVTLVLRGTAILIYFDSFGNTNNDVILRLSDLSINSVLQHLYSSRL
jgi:structural maintenance of chromosome 1